MIGVRPERAPDAHAIRAVHDGQVVGHVAISRARLGEDEVLALGPIGVLPAYRPELRGTFRYADAFPADA